MPVAVVTGSNKGIGLAIVRALCKKYQGDVFLTSRDQARGLDAVAALKKEGLHPKFLVLDIDNEETIVKLRNFMVEKYGGIDILVNNAGILFMGSSTVPFGEQATLTLAINYWGTKKVCQILFPILRPGARVVNMSSSAGFLPRIQVGVKNKVKNDEIVERLSADDLTVEELDVHMKNFEETAQTGTHADDGWPDVYYPLNNSTYIVSKVGLSALTRIQQREMATDPRPDIAINHVHPGLVDTDMTGHAGFTYNNVQFTPTSVERGAEAPVFAALLPPGTSMRGAYIWHDCQVVDWVKGPMP